MSASVRKNEMVEQERQAQEELREREGQLRLFIEYAPAALAMFDRDMRYLAASHRWIADFGLDGSNLVGRSHYEIFPEQPESKALHRRCLSGEVIHAEAEPFVLETGDRQWLCREMRPWKKVDGSVSGIVIFSEDVTERMEAEHMQQRLNRILRSLYAGGRALVHAQNEVDYLHEFCRIVVEDCGYAMIWIGYREDDAKQSIRPVAHAGFDDGYLETLQLSWADCERGKGPTGTAIRTAQTIICHNMHTDPNFLPWREQALKRGYSSSIAIPLCYEANVLGALNIYSALPAPFCDLEVQLLQKLANELCFGINVLRLRASRDLDEAALKLSESRYRLLASATFEGIAVTEYGRIIDCNNQLLSMLGYTREEMLGMQFGNLIPPEEYDMVLKNLESDESLEEHDLICKDGTHIRVEAHGQQFEVGKRMTALRDVTVRRRIEQELVVLKTRQPEVR